MLTKKTAVKLAKAQTVAESEPLTTDKVNESTTKRSRQAKVSKRCKRETAAPAAAASKRANSHMTKANSSNSAASSNTNGLSNIPLDDTQFTKNVLFHTPTSLLTKLDLKVLFQPAIFESFPRYSQLKLIKLLPECDRQLDSHGSFK